MKERNIYCITAAILPVLIGLGLIEISVEREPSLALLAGGVICLALLIAFIAALALDLATSEPSRGRRHSKQGARFSA